MIILQLLLQRINSLSNAKMQVKLGASRYKILIELFELPSGMSTGRQICGHLLTYNYFFSNFLMMCYQAYKVITLNFIEKCMDLIIKGATMQVETCF